MEAFVSPRSANRDEGSFVSILVAIHATKTVRKIPRGACPEQGRRARDDNSLARTTPASSVTQRPARAASAQPSLVSPWLPLRALASPPRPAGRAHRPTPGGEGSPPRG